MAKVAWLMPTVFPFVAAIPNGGKRAKRTAVTLRKEGVRKGFPDVVVILARGPWHGLLIEFKRSVGGTVSDEQAELHALYRAQGYRVDVCHGCVEAWSVFSTYVNLPNAGTTG